MMFRWINSQGHKSFEIDVVTIKKSMTDCMYHHLITQQSMGRNEYGKSGHLSILTLLKHLMMMVLKYILIRASFLHLIKDTDSM